MAKALTDAKIRNLRHEAARREIPDSAKGLYLIVQAQPSTVKSWAVRYRYRKDPRKPSRKMTIGTYPVMSLADARIKAIEIMRAVAAGNDPARERQAEVKEREVTSVAAIAEEYIIRKISKLKPKSSYEITRVIRKEIVPAFGEMPLANLRKIDVVRLFNKITDRGKPVMANRMYVHLRSLIRWAKATGYLADTRAVDDFGELLNDERERTRKPSMAELRLIWLASASLDPRYRDIVRLLMLTAQRREEVAQARWSEFDLDKGVWLLPGERAKNKQPHAVALSAEALKILKDLPRNGSDLLFPAGGRTAASFSYNKTKLDARIAVLNGGNPIEAWVLHDLRRAAASHMCEDLDVSTDVADALLNHLPKGMKRIYIQAVYAKRSREALERWSDYLIQAVNDGEPAVRPAADITAVATA